MREGEGEERMRVRGTRKGVELRRRTALEPMDEPEHDAIQYMFKKL